jgi:hypothetical protein
LLASQRLLLLYFPGTILLPTFLPSIIAGSGTAVLTSLFFISKKLICEVRIKADGKTLDFDFASREYVTNVRVQESTHQIRDENNEIVLELATAAIQVIFHYSGVGCNFEFSGTEEERTYWRKAVLDEFSMEKLRGY